MINKKLHEIELNDIENLITNTVKEGKTIEYKQSLDIDKTSDSKKEFLFDVSSFANASGGDIIYGIKENKETGYPEEIVGIEVSNTDQLESKINSLLRDSVVPKLPSISFRFLLMPNKDSNYVMILRIAKSWNKPHQVTFRGTDKFYTRSSNGKYKLDIFELRNAFNFGNTLQQGISKFRNERISEIISNNGSCPLLDNGKIILQAIPLISLEAGFTIDLKEVKKDRHLLRPLASLGSFKERYNFDGVLSTAIYLVNQPSPSYLQIFRNGIVETVNSWIIQPDNEYGNRLYLFNIEDSIIDLIKQLIELYDNLNLTPPIALLLTLTGTYGYEAGSRFQGRIGERIEKDVLKCPEILIENWENIDLKLKPWFDSLWNAVGKEESPSYTSNKWVKRE